MGSFIKLKNVNGHTIRLVSGTLGSFALLVSLQNCSKFNTESASSSESSFSNQAVNANLGSQITCSYKWAAIFSEDPNGVDQNHVNVINQYHTDCNPNNLNGSLFVSSINTYPNLNYTFRCSAVPTNCTNPIGKLQVLLLEPCLLMETHHAAPVTSAQWLQIALIIVPTPANQLQLVVLPTNQFVRG